MSSSQKSDKTLSSKITALLRESIISGAIPPGAKLSEPKIAEEYATSRGPVRESIRRLESMGLVRHVAHEGVRVVSLSLDQVIDIYHVREALEGKAAALAAANISDEQCTGLRQLLEEHARHQHTTGEYPPSDADFDFHYRIIQSSQNDFLIRQLCEDLYHRVRMFRYQSRQFRHRPHRALVEHQQILDAIEQRNPALAETLMRHHIARAREDIAEHFSASHAASTSALT